MTLQYILTLGGAPSEALIMLLITVTVDQLMPGAQNPCLCPTDDVQLPIPLLSVSLCNVLQHGVRQRELSRRPRGNSVARGNSVGAKFNSTSSCDGAWWRSLISSFCSRRCPGSFSSFWFRFVRAWVFSAAARLSRVTKVQFPSWVLILSSSHIFTLLSSHFSCDPSRECLRENS